MARLVISRSRNARVYAAELTSGVRYLGYIPPEEAQSLINEVVRSTWWKKRSSIREGIFTYTGTKRQSGHARVEDGIGYIDLCSGLMHEGLIAHEMTHIMVDSAYDGMEDDDDHGPAFCRGEVDYYKRWLGPTSSLLLKQSFAINELL